MRRTIASQRGFLLEFGVQKSFSVLKNWNMFKVVKQSITPFGSASLVQMRGCFSVSEGSVQRILLLTVTNAIMAGPTR
jgi:hypothetical protein